MRIKMYPLHTIIQNTNSILEYTVRLCLRLLPLNPDNVKLLETLRFVLDPERFYYRYKG